MDIPPSVLYNIVPFGSTAQKGLQADSKPLLAGPEPIPASSELHPAGSAVLPLSFEIDIVFYGAAAQSLQNCYQFNNNKTSQAEGIADHVMLLRLFIIEIVNYI